MADSSRDITRLLELLRELQQIAPSASKSIAELGKNLIQSTAGLDSSKLDKFSDSLSRTIETLSGLSVSGRKSALTAQLEDSNTQANKLVPKLAEARDIVNSLSAGARLGNISGTTPTGGDKTLLSAAGDIERITRRAQEFEDNYRRIRGVIQEASGATGQQLQSQDEVTEAVKLTKGELQALSILQKQISGETATPLLRTGERLREATKAQTEEQKRQKVEIKEAERALRSVAEIEKRQLSIRQLIAKEAEKERRESDRILARAKELEQAAAKRAALQSGGAVNIPGVGPTVGGVAQVFGGDPSRIANFESRLQKMGLSLQNITGISRDATTGLNTISLSMERANGIVDSATLHIDRFGRLVGEHSNRFKSFGEIISNNITKIFTWSIAIGVVYGSFRKLTETIGQIISIEQDMAQIGIATGKTGEELRKFFETAVDVANVIGIDATEALKQFDNALRFVGRGEGDIKRVEVATALLKDSLIFARLAGIEQADAMDTLTAALRQSNLGLDQGIILLDKFQAVAKASGASIDDMAKTFANAAQAAEGVDIETNKLVGIIGALSQSTTLSSQEINNALRAMFANFTTDTAINSLSKFNIAVKDFRTGEFRSFTDVFDQISRAIREGILSERDVAEIANALGGGSRRGAQVLALIQQWSRAMDLATVSAGANGDAQEALGQVSETVQSNVNRLKNAFLEFSESLGTEGGLIDFLNTSLQTLTELIRGLSDITGALGPATTALLVFGAGWAFLKDGALIARLREMVSLLLVAGKGSIISSTARPATRGIGVPLIDQGGVSANLFAPGRITEALKAGFAGAAPALITTIAQVLSGADIGETFARNAGGALLGFLTGNPALALVGIAIGNAVFDTLEKRSEERATAEKIVKGEIKVDDKELQELQTIFNQLSAGGGLGTRLPGSEANAQLKQIAEQFRNLQKDIGTAEARKVFLEQGLGQKFLGGTSFFFDIDQIQKAADILDLIDEKVNKILVDSGEGIFAGFGEVDQTQYEKFRDSYKTLFEKLQREQQFSLIDLLGKQPSQGGITGAEYQRRIETLQPAIRTVPNIISTLGLGDLDKGQQQLDRLGITLEELYGVLVNAPEEETLFLGNLSSAVSTSIDDLEQLQDAYKEFQLTGRVQTLDQEQLKKLGVAALTEKDFREAISAQIQGQDEMYNAFVAFLTRLEQAGAEAEPFRFKGFTGTEATGSELDAIVERALKLQQIYAEDTNINLNDIISNADSFIVKYSDGFKEITGLEQAFFSESVQGWEDYKKQIEQASDFNLKSLRDIPAAEADRLQRGINYYTNLLRQYGFDEPNQLLTILFKDNQVRQLIGSQTALQLALEDLTDVTKKQLEGVYNLPAGAVAYVPISSVFNPPDQPGGGGGFPNYPEAPTLELTPASITDPITSRLDAIHQTLLDQRIEQQTLPDTLKNSLIESNKNLFDKFGIKELFEGRQPYGPGLNEQGGPLSEVDQSLSTLSDVIVKLPPEIKAAIGEGFDLIKGLGGPTTSLLLDTFGEQFGNLLKQFIKPTEPVSQGGPGGGVSRLESPPITVQPAPVNIRIHQEPVRNEFLANIRLNVSGRQLANVIKPFLFEDYQRLTGSVGNSGRQSENIVVS